MGRDNIRRIKCKHYFKVNSSEPIDLDDLKISIQSKENIEESKEYNPLLLVAMWACFQSYRQGELKENGSKPWEDTVKGVLEKKGTEISEEEREWIMLLNEVLKDEDTKWSNNVEEICRRVIEAYNKIRS